MCARLSPKWKKCRGAASLLNPVIPLQQRARHDLSLLVSIGLYFGQLRFERRAVGVERGARLLLETFDVADGLLAFGRCFAQIRETVRERVELALLVRDELLGLICAMAAAASRGEVT